MQISEWMGHSAATLLTHYAHPIADLPSGPGLPDENAIKTARGAARLSTQNSQIVPGGNKAITYWYIGRGGLHWPHPDGRWQPFSLTGRVDVNLTHSGIPMQRDQRV
jgi:hypothetical protein